MTCPTTDHALHTHATVNCLICDVLITMTVVQPSLNQA